MKKEDIDRINELARKAKTVGLTPEENEERAVLRRAYIDSVVGDLRQQLDNTYIVEGPWLERLMGTVMVNSGFLVLWRQTYIPASTPRLPKQAANASSSASGTRRR